MKYRLILVDRDGVLNHPATKQQKYIYKDKDFVIYHDVRPFVQAVVKAGVKIAVITNQRGISLGMYTDREVINLHKKLIDHCKIENTQMKLFFCPHNMNECECRKPKSGLLRQAIESELLNFSDVLFIGDQESDRLAANDLNIDFIKVNRSKNSANLKSLIEILEIIR